MIYLFSDCELDTRRHILMREGREVAVEPQVFALLVFLAKNHGRLVTKDEIIDAVWQGRMLAAQIPNAQFMQMESRNHVPLPTVPVFGQVLRATLEFIG